MTLKPQFMLTYLRLIAKGVLPTYVHLYHSFQYSPSMVCMREEVSTSLLHPKVSGKGVYWYMFCFNCLVGHNCGIEHASTQPQTRCSATKADVFY